MATYLQIARLFRSDASRERLRIAMRTHAREVLADATATVDQQRLAEEVLNSSRIPAGRHWPTIFQDRVADHLANQAVATGLDREDLNALQETAVDGAIKNAVAVVWDEFVPMVKPN